MKEDDTQALRLSVQSMFKPLMMVANNIRLTWRELKMAKSHTNTVELALTVRIPNDQDIPRMGRRMKVASSRPLKVHYTLLLLL